MSESRAISTRLIGEIFVERGLITHEQLAQALQVQSDSGGMLGEILVASFGVSRIALAGVLAEQWSAVERQADVERSESHAASSTRPSNAPAPSVEEAMEEMARKPLGEIFVERGMATGEQLEHALEIQRESGERLGEILVRLGVIERLELAGALAEQWSGLQKLRPPAPKKVESWQELGGTTGVPHDGGGGDPVSAPELKRIGESVASLEQQVVALASRPDPDLTTLRATTRAVEERLADLEGRLNDIPAADALADVRSAVERLERAVGGAASAQALDEVRLVADSATDQLRPRLDELAAGVTALAARVDELAGAELPTVRGNLDETRSLLDGLGARLEQVADSVAGAALRGDDTSVAEQVEQRLADAIGAVGSRLDELESRLANVNDEPVSLEPLRQTVEGLAARVSGLAQDRPELDGALAERPTRAELEGMVAELRNRVDEALARDPVAELDAALFERPTRSELDDAVAGLSGRLAVLAATLDGLGAQLEGSREAAESGSREAPVADVAALVAPLVAPLAERVAAVEHGVAGAARGTELAALAGDVTGQLDQLRGSLDALRVDGSQALDTAVVELRGWLEAVQGRLDDAAGRPELAALAGDLRARIDALATLAEAVPTGVLPELEELRGRVDGLCDTLSGTVRRDELDARLTSLGGQLDELSSRVAALGSSPDGLATDVRALREELDGLGHHAVENADDSALSTRTDALELMIASLAARLDELSSGLGGLRDRVDGLPTAESLAALEADVSGRLDAVGARLEAGASAGRVDGLESAVAELQARIASLREHGEGAAGADDLARIHAVLAGHDAALAARASSDALAETAAALEARLAALELGGGALDRQLADIPSRVELQAAVISLEGRLREDVDQRVTAAVANAAEAAHVTRLGAGLDAIAEELRSALAHLHGRIDELAAGQGHFGGRLAAVELAAGSSGAVDEVAEDLAALRVEVERQAALADERTKVAERAIRKGLAGLGERLVASEQAYVETGSSLRRAVERLGAAVVEADARLEGAPLDPPSGGHVAFVPTADGYRLRSIAGPAPAVGELVELVPGEAPFHVVRATLSPLPLDRRVCVYLEPVAPS